MKKQIFKEKQRYRRWELILLLGLLSIGWIYRFVEQQMTVTGDEGLSLITFLSCLALMLGIMAYYVSLKLTVKVTDEHISFRYHPWQGERHLIKWSDVDHYEIIKTSEMAQWNGWNVNYANEQVFSVNGRNGISIMTNDGQQYFIGSKDIEGLKKAVDKAFD